MTLSTRRCSFALLFLTLALAGAVVLAGWRFNGDMERARAQAARGSVLLQTRCGAIQYQEAGTGVPLLAVHGSGGGHDQGMAFAGALSGQGVRAIAMSRFGYLRTPMPVDASAAAQADAQVCLLDALGIQRAAVMGGSAGAPSALQMALRPDLRGQIRPRNRRRVAGGHRRRGGHGLGCGRGGMLVARVPVIVDHEFARR